MNMEQETFKIRTHQQCVKDAKKYCKEHNLNLSLIDREAIVEYFLIVDLNALVSYNSEVVSNKIVFSNVSKKQQRFLEALLRGYCSLSIALPNVIKFFQSLIDIAQYGIVRKSINESLIRKSFTNIKTIKQIVNIQDIILDTLQVAIYFAQMNGVIDRTLSVEGESTIDRILSGEEIEFNKVMIGSSLMDITNYDNASYFDDKRFSKGHAFEKNTHDLEKLSPKSLIDKKQHELIDHAIEKVFEKTPKISDD